MNVICRALTVYLLISSLSTGVARARPADRPLRDAWVVHEYAHHNRPQEFNVSLALWANTLAAALWYAIPILPDGFIDSVNDSFDIEFGGAVAAWRSQAYWHYSPTYLSFLISGGGRWNFHLTPNWTTFATLKLGLNYGLAPYNPDFVSPGLSLGALYRISDDLRFRMELGFPLGIAIGLTFPVGKT